MHFEIIGPIEDVEVIARGRGIRTTLGLLRKRHGGRNWRKLKANATVRLVTGSVRRAEVHWYEAHGMGRIGWKIKRFVD
jgi:hypothetical protein